MDSGDETAKACRDVDFITSPTGPCASWPNLEPDCRFERERVEEIIVFFGSARALPLPEAEKLLETARIMEACKRGAREAGGRRLTEPGSWKRSWSRCRSGPARSRPVGTRRAPDPPPLETPPDPPPGRTR